MRLIWLMILVLSACSTATETVTVGPFPKGRDALVDIAAADARATEEGRLLMIVIGADWCHDSKAMVQDLQSPEAAPIVGAYEVVLVDVGYFEAGDAVMRRWADTDLFTHTPTVLIIDPQTDRFLNWSDHMMWRDAHKLGREALIEYLQRDWASAAAVPWDDTTPAMQAISAFEAAQLSRIKAAYARLGPKLRARSDDLDTDWKPVSKLRYALPDDRLALRRAVHARQNAGGFVDPASLTFPVYPAFPWEELPAGTVN